MVAACRARATHSLSERVGLYGQARRDGVELRCIDRRQRRDADQSTNELHLRQKPADRASQMRRRCESGVGAQCECFSHLQRRKVESRELSRTCDEPGDDRESGKLQGHEWDGSWEDAGRGQRHTANVREGREIDRFCGRRAGMDPNAAGEGGRRKAERADDVGERRSIEGAAGEGEASSPGECGHAQDIVVRRAFAHVDRQLVANESQR